MSILRNQHEIVEAKIGTFEFDGLEWDCYGVIHPEGPELIQIALAGTDTDLFDLLNLNHINSMTALIERKWLDGQIRKGDFRLPRIMLQAH